MEQVLERGICRLSIVPVRAEGRESAEQVTQLLFGDYYSVLEESKDRNWLHIKIAFDGYEGWINIKQHTTATEEFFEEVSSLNYVVSGEISSPLYLHGQPYHIVMGSVLPITGNELFNLNDKVNFTGKIIQVTRCEDFKFLKSIAFQYINTPYLWGGKTPFGIDCSGLVQMVYKMGGYTLKRDAYQQAQQGKTVKALAEAMPGDLAFFNNEKGKIVHVGMILENNQIIHASGKVRVDKLDEKGILNEKKGIYTHNLCSIRRFIT